MLAGESRVCTGLKEGYAAQKVQSRPVMQGVPRCGEGLYASSWHAATSQTTRWQKYAGNSLLPTCVKLERLTAHVDVGPKPLAATRSKQSSLMQVRCMRGSPARQRRHMLMIVVLVKYSIPALRKM